MEFWSTIVGLLRRPKVIVPILLAALTLGAVAFMGTPVTYVSSTTMVLTTDSVRRLRVHGNRPPRPR